MGTASPSRYRTLEGVADAVGEAVGSTQGRLSRLTFEGANIRTRWSPDGQSLTFLSNRAENCSTTLDQESSGWE